jgi:2-methylisocitrate lyase-like PEP mutase family enzyme
VIARTDALAGSGVEAAVERGCAYADAGADVVFVEAPPSLEVLGELPRRIPAPLLLNMVEGGRTPLLDAAGAAALGYRVVLYANTALRAGAWAVREALAALRRDGSSAAVSDRLLTWDDRQRLVGLEEMQQLAARYADAAVAPGERANLEVDGHG